MAFKKQCALATGRKHLYFFNTLQYSFFYLLLGTNEQLEGQRLIVFREELRIFIYVL